MWSSDVAVSAELIVRPVLTHCDDMIHLAVGNAWTLCGLDIWSLTAPDLSINCHECLDRLEKRRT